MQEATINHMVDKCHCVLPCDGTHEEINQFYDWDAWAEAEGISIGGEGLDEPAPENSDAGGGGAGADGGDDGEWEEMDEDEVAALEVATDQGEEQEQSDGDGDGDGEAAAGRSGSSQLVVAQRAGARGPKSTATPSAAAAVDGDDSVHDMVQELVLPGGRRAGHRSLARYYKQSVRPERQVSGTCQRRRRWRQRVASAASGAITMT